jgi:hypothetical protein
MPQKAGRGNRNRREVHHYCGFASPASGVASDFIAAYEEKLRRKFREIALKSLHDHHMARLAWPPRRSRNIDLRDGRFGTGRRVEQPNRSSRISLRRTA